MIRNNLYNQAPILDFENYKNPRNNSVNINNTIFKENLKKNEKL